MISGAYTSSEKAGRLFFKRTAVFFWEDSEWGAGLFARAPKGEPVYFSMICSASSSRRRLICHVVSARHPARDVQRENPHKPNTLLSPVFGICSRFGSIQPSGRREPCPAPALTSQGSGGAWRRSQRGSPYPASQADCRIFPSQDRCRPPIAWPMVMIRFISCSFPTKAF